MDTFKGDLHIHTTLSPCGNLQMSPATILQRASAAGIQLLGITDHNSTRQAPLLMAMGKEHDILVLGGAELCSKEEVHCLALMPCLEHLDALQKYIDSHLPAISNQPAYFGYQVQVDEDENISYEEERLLLTALDQSVHEIAEQVHALGGLFIPAHIDRPSYSLMSQLGFVPDSLPYDALELSGQVQRSAFLQQHPELRQASFVQSSDAHHPDSIGAVCSHFRMQELSFEELRLALLQQQGRSIQSVHKAR